MREYLHPTLSVWLGVLVKAEKTQLACGLLGQHVQLSHNPQGTRACTQGCAHRHIHTGTQMPCAAESLSLLGEHVLARMCTQVHRDRVHLTVSHRCQAALREGTESLFCHLCLKANTHMPMYGCMPKVHLSVLASCTGVCVSKILVE